MFGLLVSVVVYFSESINGSLKNGISLNRNEHGLGEKSIQLTAKVDETEQNLEITLAERELSEEEMLNFFEELKRIIPTKVLNSNRSLNDVTDDLLLPTSIGGFPFQLRWKVSNEEIMDSKGTILRNWDDENMYELTITCTAWLKDFHQDMLIPVRVVPKQYTNEEQLAMRLEEMVKRNEEETRHSILFNLPSSIEGNHILWKERKNMTPIWIFLGALVTALTVSWAFEYDEKQKERKEEEILVALYPSFVEKFRMYLMAGLSTRNAFDEMYEELADSNNPRYRKMKGALQKVVNKLKNHVPERKTYEEFGNECKGPYKRFCYILSVNLKQGNDKVLEMLEEEAVKALEMRKEIAKRKGDEAGVKILFPMVLMLMVVMILIIIPAYMNFN